LTSWPVSSGTPPHYCLRQAGGTITSWLEFEEATRYPRSLTCLTASHLLLSEHSLETGLSNLSRNQAYTTACIPLTNKISRKGEVRRKVIGDRLGIVQV